MKIIKVSFFLALAALSSVFAQQKAVLFNDTSAWYHWGCTGTSIALKKRIESLGFELTAFPINATYAFKEVPPFESFDDPESFKLFCEKNNEAVDAIKSADAIVITGEGTIHDLRAGPQALLYLAHASKVFLGKHVEIINHSAYPKDDPELSSTFIANFGVEKEKALEELAKAQSIYKSAYDKLDFVAIRESFSLKEMEKIGVSAPLSFDCLPLYIRDHYKNPKQLKQKNLVLAGSVAYTEPGAKQLCQYLEETAKAGFKIKVLIGARAFPARDDKVFVDFLTTYCKAPWELVDATSMDQWLDTIHNATLLVSGRFHHSIAAFCLNTPFISLNSNTHKVHAICSMMGEAEPLLFSDPNLLDQLNLRTAGILSAPAPDNTEKVKFLCDLAEKNFDGLRSLAEKKAMSQ
jgi:polysaccharide pyruvyl transferase WcaK-like protein